MTNLPRRTKSQQVGQSAADLFSALFTKFCNVIPVPQDRDLGIDFICEIIQGEKPTGKLFNIQCKGTEEAEINEKYRQVSIKTSTLNYWLLQPNPTFLIVVDCRNHKFFWTFPRAFISSIKKNWQQQETICIPVSNQNYFDKNIDTLPDDLISIVKKHASAKPRLDYLGTLRLYYSSIIIDGLFLSNAILDTRKFYSNLYPEKDIQIPSIYSVINKLFERSNFKTETKYFCYLVRPNKDIFELSGIRYLDERNDESYLDDSVEFTDEIGRRDCKLILNDFETSDFVWAEVESLVERFVSVENVLLVANDPAYFSVLEKMQCKGIEILWARPQPIDLKLWPSESYSTKWFDVAYPIAEAMGLEEHEW